MAEFEVCTDDPPSANSLNEFASIACVARPKSPRSLTSVSGTGVALALGMIDQVLGDVEHWYTVREAALLCHRAEGTIRNLLSKHKLPRRLARGPGRKPRRIALLSASTIQTLQRLTLGLTASLMTEGCSPVLVHP